MKTGELKKIGDKYRVTLSCNVARDFATYFVDQGIPVEYMCEGSGTYRTISFREDACNADLMIAWINRWNAGHEFCPFCGGLPKAYWTDDVNHPVKKFVLPHAYICCTKCGASSAGFMDSEDYAWEKWNKRVGVG